MSAPLSSLDAVQAIALQPVRPVVRGREKSAVYDLHSALKRDNPAPRRAAARPEETEALAQERAYRDTARRMRSGPGLDSGDPQKAGLPLNPALSAPLGGASGDRPAESTPQPGNAASRNARAEQSSPGGKAESAATGRTDTTGGEEARGPERSFLGGASGAAADPEAARREKDSAPASGEDGEGPQDLDEQEQAQVEEMKARDREVRAHEQAHMSAGGGLVNGGPSYQQERGPDGNMYAVGGEVSIDTSEGSTPEETIAKARRVKAAALAPAEPSAQDRQVAAQAAQMETQARAEKAAGNREDSGPAAEGKDRAAENASGEQGGPLSSSRTALEAFAGEAAASGAGESGNTLMGGMSRRASLSYERAASGRAPFSHTLFSRAV